MGEDTLFRSFFWGGGGVDASSALAWRGFLLAAQRRLPVVAGIPCSGALFVSKLSWAGCAIRIVGGRLLW